MKPITSFWFESNSCWGMVSDAGEWEEMILRWVACDYGHGLREPRDLFEAKATFDTEQETARVPNFGFRMEHQGRSLDLWIEEGLMPSWVEETINRLQTMPEWVSEAVDAILVSISEDY